MKLSFESFALPEDHTETNNLKPFSSIFKDRYHSDDGAYAEANHVFIKSNELDKKLREKESLIIGELGFGFGVGFLETAKFLNNFNKNLKGETEGSINKKIHFFSIEGYPQTKENFIAWHKEAGSFNDPELSPLLDDLLLQYPPCVKGTHRLFIGDDIILTLAYHSVEYARTVYSFLADCWYLDGFSPSKNPEMWNLETFSWIYKNTSSNGTFSTYSVSESVRTAALEAGFDLRKITGFANKAYMLKGWKNEIQESESNIKRHNKGRTPRIAIIGAGLAGACIAYSLSRRGIYADIFESEHAPALKASGNPAAIFMPQLSSVPDALSRYFLNGYLHSLRMFKVLEKKIKLSSLKQDGVLRLTNVKKWKTVESRLKSLGIPEQIVTSYSTEEIAKIFNLSCKESALYFKESGSIQPSELLEVLLTDNINVHTNSKVTSIFFKNEKVELQCNQKDKHTYDHVIFANAFEVFQFPEYAWIPIEKIKGQLFSSKISPDSETPSIPLCYDGYTVPLQEKNSEILIGATYEHNAHETIFDSSVREELLSRLQTHFPNVKIEKDIDSSRVCFRTTSPDRFPMIGKLTLRDGNKTNTFCSLGHGSHGTTSCFLAAEILSSIIMNEPLPVEDDVMREIEPERFLLRERRRNKTLENIYPASYLWREK